MLKINDKILTNEEVLALLEQETGLKRIKQDIVFTLLENYQSSIKILNDMGEARWVKKYQSTFGLVNQYDRRNFRDGGTETCVYYTNVVKDPTRGDRYHTGDMNKIMFYNGTLVVRAGQEDLLLWLRMNEQCQTNKYWSETDSRGNQKYTPTRAFLYKEIIPEYENEQQYQEIAEILAVQAIALDPDKLNYAQAITMATGYGMVDAQFKGEKAVRIYLVNRAKANPDQFMKDLQDSKFELRAKVNTAFQWGIVKWDAPYIRWNKKMDGDNRITSVPLNRDHVEYFTLWLKDIDKSGTLNVLLNEVDKESLKSHGIQFHEKENNPYADILSKLGVNSIEEAQRLIGSAKNGKAEQTPKEHINNTAVDSEIGYTAEQLRHKSFHELRDIASSMGIKAVHLFKKTEALCDAILKKQKEVVAVA